MYFVTPILKKEIENNVINKMFPSLNIEQKNMIRETTFDLIDLIAIKFNFELKERELYEGQFRQNNYRDVKGLILLLFPYISQNDLSGLRDLRDLYIKKKSGSSDDINTNSPQYEYTNLQYGRCLRDRDYAREISFNEEHFKHNYQLLKLTVVTIANKLFVNWIHLLPINISEEKLDLLPVFTETKKAFQENRLKEYDPVSEDEESRNYRGLTVDEVYNTISNYLYHDIKNIKWLIYDLKVGQTLVPYITVWNELLGLDPALNQVSWFLLSTDTQKKVSENFKKIIDSAQRGIGIGDIDSNGLNLLLKVLLIFFSSERHKSRDDLRILRQATNDGFKALDLDPNLNGEEDEQPDVKTDDLYLSANSLQIEHLYEFFRSQINALTTTWFASHLIENVGDQKKLLNRPQIQKNVSDLFSYKNVYNYAKSLTHKQEEVGGKKVYSEFPKVWRGLDETTKQTVLSRLNWSPNKTVTEWFNIRRYLSNVLNLSGTQAEAKNQQIFKDIQQGLIRIVLEIMQSKGILSRFRPNPLSTDNAKLPDSDREKSNVIKENIKREVTTRQKYYDGCYHFLNGKRYSELTIHDKSGKYTFFEHLYKIFPGSWPTTYAMDWISQIGFFHHFLNNQIIYITGATGVGKSSQVPKLLIYALKSIDFNSNGSVAVTQPRIPPTEGTARTLSLQMGVPIEEYNESIKTQDDDEKKLPSKNYHIQFQHKQKKHEGSVHGLLLTVMTDGFFFNSVLRPNILLREKSRSQKYLDSNQFDIVAVDESHEHNANMDLILSLVKNTVYYNKSVRLIIISATMEEDEPSYRRFYRDINDNLMYPFNSLLLKYNLDRINVDRRFHISPPGETTRFSIEDHYVPNISAENVILDILKKSNSGDILYFLSSKEKIRVAVDDLNQKLPNNTIALPYHKDLPDSEKQFIETLTEKSKSDIVRSKNAESAEKVSKGTYNRVVIVATTLAEASITIGTLKYVVDSGLRYLVPYNYEARMAIPKEVPISETSRVQRRGRVGRTSDGIVYYLYDKGSHGDIPTLYDISISDASGSIYDLMRDSSEEKQLLEKDPHTLNIDLTKLADVYQNGLDRMIKSQWFIGGKYLDYRGNSKHYDYQNNKPPHSFYQSGFDHKSLEDNKGTFYIIHPDELNLIRNILGHIVGVKRPDALPNLTPPKFNNNEIISMKINSFWDLMEEKSCLVKPTDGSAMYKTEFGTKLSKLKLGLDFNDYSSLIAYLYSRSYGVSNDMIINLAMIQQLQGSIVRLANQKDVNGEFIRQFAELKSIYGNYKGDCCVLVAIGRKVIDFINKQIINIGQVGNIDPKLVELIIKQKREYMLHTKDKNFSNVNPHTLKMLIKMDHKGRLSQNENLSEREQKDLIGEDTNISEIMNKINSEKEKIVRWSMITQFLDPDTVVGFVKNYLYLKQKLYKYDRGIFGRETIPGTVDMNWFDQRLDIITKNSDDCLNLIFSLLHGYGYNIAKRIQGADLYVNINYPEPELVKSIKRIGLKDKTNIPYKGYPIKDTFLKLENIGEYILYLTDDIGGFSIIQTVRPDQIQKTVPFIYTPSRMNQKIDIYAKNKKAVAHLVNSLKREQERRFIEGSAGFKERLNLPPQLVGNYNRTLDTIRPEFINTYDPKIWFTLNKLDSRSRYITDLEERKKYEEQIKREGILVGGSNENSFEIELYRGINPYVLYLYRQLSRKN